MRFVVRWEGKEWSPEQFAVGSGSRLDKGVLQRSWYVAEAATIKTAGNFNTTTIERRVRAAHEGPLGKHSVERSGLELGKGMMQRSQWHVGIPEAATILTTENLDIMTVEKGRSGRSSSLLSDQGQSWVNG